MLRWSPTGKGHLSSYSAFLKKKKEWKRRPRRAGKGWEGPGGRALAAVSRRSLPPAGSATAVSLPQEVCAGSEAWKMTEDSPSSRKGSDTPVDGERRPRWAQGSCPGPPRPERLCLHMPRPPLSLGLLLRGTPLPGPPAWPHVPYMGGAEVRPPGMERPACAVPTNAFAFTYPEMKPHPGVPFACMGGDPWKVSGATCTRG